MVKSTSRPDKKPALSTPQAQEDAMAKPQHTVPTADLIPLQFRMPPEFVKAFKQTALDNGMKLNALLVACFEEFQKNRF